MADFDFNIDENEIEDISLGAGGKTLPPKNDLIALIDADTLVFGPCSSLEEQEELLNRDMYTDEEWEEIIHDPGYDEHTNSIFRINLDEAFSAAKEKLQTILDNTGCQDYELHFTGGRTSFRYTDVTFTYKANRNDINGKRAPVGLSELKEMFVEDGKSYYHTKWEADDIVVCKKKYFPDKYLLVALDKDVLYSLPGRHFNYYTRAAGVNRWGNSLEAIDMKFFEVTEEEATKHHYIQTLTGDKGDNVIGLDGIGPKKAEKILANCTTEKEMWEAVCDAYESKGRDIIDALTNMRLVHMQQLYLVDEAKDEWEVRLWSPKSL